MFKRICKLFGIEKKENVIGGLKPEKYLMHNELYTKVVRCITYWCSQNKINYYSFEIHAIFIENSEKLKLTVWLNHPGVFIGKQGKVIDSIQMALAEEFKKEVSINMEEFNPLVGAWQDFNDPF